MKYLILSFLFFSTLAFSQTTITPGMEIATPTPFPTPTPTALATIAGENAPPPAGEAPEEQEDTRGWNEKLYGGKPVYKTKTAAKNEQDLEQETKQMQAELEAVQKEIQEKGPTAILTNPEFAKKVMKVMGGGGKTPKSPFAGVSDDEIKSLIKNRVVGTPVEGFLNSHPNILTFAVRFFKDDKAFLSLMKIATQEKKLKVYMAVVIFLFLLSFLFNLVGGKNAPFWKRLLRKIVVTIFILCCQFGALYYFFSEELEPTIKIAKEIFFA